MNIMSIESQYDDLISEVGDYVVCEVSHDFFEKLEHGCYDDTIAILSIICLVFIIARVIVWFMEIIRK